MKIGDFSRLGQVSVRMLRHYESLGLLIPEAVDEFTGHRRYGAGQLTRLNRIMALNALGIPLRSIAGLLDSELSSDALVEMLHRRRHQLLAEQSAAVAALAEVDFRLALIERTTMDHPDCIIKDLPPERILGRTALLGEPPFDTSEIGPLFDSVADAITETGGEPATAVGVYSETESGTEVTCGFRTSTPTANSTSAGGDSGIDGDRDSSSGPELETTELPSCTAATLVHEGPMNRIGASWQHLAEWSLAQGWELVGPCREVYLETGPDWIVELQQPVIR
ncbi:MULTISPECIES: MerR family transcriptional regulator [unclassified Brevibacterium]|uniref:MerR family transcriptional regulator n=1 Tax=unclassified Brevibacterium TaxID=2614124 RepID=UPI00109235E3|nr:MerR family transcriptional regulator [Brevibacterium sp. S22]TGD32769.1 MerR family transcriptional regulator [Brevibacterium sp. S22]